MNWVLLKASPRSSRVVDSRSLKCLSSATSKLIVPLTCDVSVHGRRLFALDRHLGDFRRRHQGGVHVRLLPRRDRQSFDLEVLETGPRHRDGVGAGCEVGD